MKGHFDAPILELMLSEKNIDITDTPFFYNDHGVPTYLKTLPENIVPLTPAKTDPQVAIGREHTVPDWIGKKDVSSGQEVQLDFEGHEIEYEPMWATREVAAAFGITLVEQGQAVELSSPVSMLTQAEYEYGVFAGHWSPYQNTGNQLLTVVCTDLEHHDFPHIFASTDPNFPLVISVGRYWRNQKKIRLADLWVPQGSALYIPPKPLLLGQECIDLHNNRNSARACWGTLGENSVKTHTLLQMNNGYFYWFWNRKPTVHRNLI